MQTDPLPIDPQARKNIPLVRGLLDYFPAALAAVAEVSRVGNDQHNPGQPMHWARGKSTDHADCLMRHLMGRGTIDTDGLPHSAKLAWRALALLEEELEAAGAPLARGARLPTEVSSTGEGEGDRIRKSYDPAEVSSTGEGEGDRIRKSYDPAEVSSTGEGAGARARAGSGASHGGGEALHDADAASGGGQGSEAGKGDVPDSTDEEIPF